MTAQLIFIGTRRPDSDDDYTAYRKVAGPLLGAAGGRPIGQYQHIDDLAGEDGPQVVGVFEFPDEAAVRSLIESPEYQAVVAHRDSAFERLNIILATAAPTG